jgi:hypothetical protein
VELDDDAKRWWDHMHSAVHWGERDLLAGCSYIIWWENRAWAYEKFGHAFWKDKMHSRIRRIDHEIDSEEAGRVRHDRG